MELKRILVLCGGKFAFPSLQTLGVEKFLCGIGIGKGEKGILSILDQESKNSGLPYMSFPTKESLSHLRNWIDEIQPDYIFSISFPFLLSEEVLSYGEDKFINFHPGPLPEYRGPMPLFEVLRYQEKETAVSVHFMSEEFDDGAIILKETLPISKNETYGELAIKLSSRTAMVALNIAQMLQYASTIPRTAQDENKARYFEKPEAIDTFIQWNRMPADEIIALINACNPWNQGADAILFGRSVKLLAATLSDELHSELPGKVLQLTQSGSIAVSCIDQKVIHIQIVAGDFGILAAERFIKTTSIPEYILN
ncbi:methionyl-tRNA formyltransferase [Fluviicola chungangensis]|uniref:Methionyl-tRNA formyltransferase n=1 Tax=Fluviicola chungangensis TaxID=2597671 RepID=A0A556MPY2_9FLAO|nr:formyltransferase family protein [Fluviicola chungangensis]TSJ41892.1 methionyl-tRNA formyltransferase [Fluviicola chungangensis]